MGLTRGILIDTHWNMCRESPSPRETRKGTTFERFVALAVVAIAGFGVPALAAEEYPFPTPGAQYEFKPTELPPPFATENVNNPPRVILRPENTAPNAPAGFSVTLFASGLTHARWMAVAANGDVFLSQSNEGRITVLRDADEDGRAELVSTFAEGFARPHGLAFREGYLYVADTGAVWRIPYRPGDTTARGGPARVTKEGALGETSMRWVRNVVFHPDGTDFFVTVGAKENIGEDPPPYGTVQRFSEDGSRQSTFAAGMRHPVGIAFYPESDDLYVVVNEREGLGDGLVPDFLARLREGDFLGWPYAYTGKNPQPGFAEKRPDLVEKSRLPDFLFHSHSAPLGLVFYEGESFPEEYRGDAFVALHGSWNSSRPIGYQVVRVPFENGRPTGRYETFVAGFWTEGVDRAVVWGRPAGLAVAKDGSLLIADDVGNAVWRVAYEGATGSY